MLITVRERQVLPALNALGDLLLLIGGYAGGGVGLLLPLLGGPSPVHHAAGGALEQERYPQGDVRLRCGALPGGGGPAGIPSKNCRRTRLVGSNRRCRRSRNSTPQRGRRRSPALRLPSIIISNKDSAPRGPCEKAPPPPLSTPASVGTAQY